MHLIYRRGGYRLDLPVVPLRPRGGWRKTAIFRSIWAVGAHQRHHRPWADITVFHQGGSHRLTLIEPLAGADDAEAPAAS